MYSQSPSKIFLEDIGKIIKNVFGNTKTKIASHSWGRITKCECVRYQDLLWKHYSDLVVNTTNTAMEHNKEYRSRHKITCILNYDKITTKMQWRKDSSINGVCLVRYPYWKKN